MPQAPRRIPSEDFFRNPERVGVKLSPSGRYLSWMAPWERRLNVFVRDIESGEERRVTSARERGVGGYTWVSDERVVFEQDSGGDENTHLFAVGADGSNPLDLTPFDGVKCDLVDDLEEVPDEILIQMNRRDPRLFDVHRLNVTTGALELVAENPGNVESWVTDHQGRLRVATTTDGVNASLLFRETEDDDWTVVATYDFRHRATPLFFTFDDEALYVTSNVGRDKQAVCELDLRTGEERRVLFEHPDVDVDALLSSKVRKVVTGVRFETDRLGYVFFDESRRLIQEAVDAKLPGGDNLLISYTRDETRYIVRSGEDRTPGAYWLLDAETLDLTHLFDLAPWLVRDELAPTRPVRYSARDGLEIHGYLTLPVGRDPEGLPLVVVPHGGPWARDTWGFRPDTQLLANRGCAVLQMNFRGSTGFGLAFCEAGFKQWGRAMQDDITDGVQWVVAQGIADPSRVGIFGGSYGGYAALAGMAFTPDLYACGISVVGVSNIFTLLASVPPYWEPALDMMYAMVGHPEHDKDLLESVSPVFHADKIRAPLLIIQGANDPRVKQAEADQMVAAMKAHDIPVEYILIEGEGHGFRNEEHMLAFGGAIERFLGEHLALPPG